VRGEETGASELTAPPPEELDELGVIGPALLVAPTVGNMGLAPVADADAQFREGAPRLEHEMILQLT
jgi:hypothetical protein